MAPDEYVAAREGAAVARIEGRGVLEVSGPTRQKFLQGMLSNDIASLAPGRGCLAALLAAKGGVLALLRVLADKDALLLETPPQRLELVQNTLEHYRVAAPVRFAARNAAILAVLGPKAGDVLRAAGADAVPSEPEAHGPATLGGHPVRLVRAADLPVPGVVLHASGDEADAVRDALETAGAHRLGSGTLDVLRIEAIRPWYGADVGEDNLLHETGLLGECHSPTKGCYVGQEIVARLEGRGGNVNKALRGLRLGAPASAADAVIAEGREVGWLTTAGVSPRLGPIALAYVQRSHLQAGSAVTVGGAPASVVTSFADSRP